MFAIAARPTVDRKIPCWLHPECFCVMLRGLKVTMDEQSFRKSIMSIAHFTFLVVEFCDSPTLIQISDRASPQVFNFRYFFSFHAHVAPFPVLILLSELYSVLVIPNPENTFA